MGSLGDCEDGITRPVSPIEDNGNSNSGPSPYAPRTEGDACKGMKWANRLLVMDDTVPVDDDFETPVLEFGGETQLVEDETDCFGYMGMTQLVDDEVTIGCDGEITDGTEVLSGNNGGRDEELSDGESVRRGKVAFLVEERKGSRDQANDTSVDGQCLSGTTRFTSVRAAFFRASGLAARKMTLEGIDDIHIRSNGGLLEKDTAEIDVSKSNASDEIYSGCATGRYDDEAKTLNCDSKCKIGSSTVQKLFTEDLLDETETLTNNDAIATSTRELELLYDDRLAGLSYVDSQDPGEASQANALACVQKLIDESKDLIDDELNFWKSGTGKKSDVATVKGPQSLAKKANAKGADVSGGIFDWDDRYEDEGGGEFFSRKKEEFFGSPEKKTSKNAQKSKKLQPDGGIGNERKSDTKNATMICEMGPSELEANGKTVKVTEKSIARNLVDDFGEEISEEQAVEQFDATSSGKNMQEILDVGVNTQMAAEAMETLFYGNAILNYDATNGQQLQKYSSEDCQMGSSRRNSEKTALSKQKCSENGFVVRSMTRKSRTSMRVSARSGKHSSSSSYKHGGKLKMQPEQCLAMTKQKRAECDTEEAALAGKKKKSDKLNMLHDQDIVMTRGKRAKFNTEKALMASKIEVCLQIPTEVVEQVKNAAPTKSNHLGELDKCRGATHGRCQSTKKRHLPEELTAFLPVAHRTRRSLVQLNDAGGYLGNSVGLKNLERQAGTGGPNGASIVCAVTSRTMIGENDLRANESGKHGSLISKLRASGDGLVFYRGKRSMQNQLNEIGSMNTHLKPSVSSGEVVPQPNGRARQSRSIDKANNAEIHQSKVRLTRSSCLGTTSVRMDLNEVSQLGVDERGSQKAFLCDSANTSKPQLDENTLEAKAESIADNPHDVNGSLSDESEVAASPNKYGKKNKAPDSTCKSPANWKTPAKVVSPVCMGNGYVNQSCKKGLSRSSLLHEISGLRAMRLEPISTPNDSRKRRDLTNVKVFFSQHLDDDLLKQQRKIVERLKVSIASSILDATHFVADQFVRTRNMLGAIAGGKPVVTHQWLEDVGRANYYIDEQKYILRDVKKEKEFGFNMSVSLAHARNNPLLQGRRVFITCSVKPGKDIVSGLVKAVQGQAVERVGRSALKHDTISDDLLVLSCEEDYEACLPFLEKGMAVYSSELLLNGIVTQRLEYERHRLFSDHVKTTRSTVWLKRDGRTFFPVKKRG